ncbi:EamA family transporter, partial [Acinetobacter pollinis]
MKYITNGWINGFIGVLIFAGSLPATRIAVKDFSPIFLTSMRATIAAFLAIFLLIILKQPQPKTSDFPSLIITSLG